MNRSEIISRLIELAGPLGPLGTEDAREQVRSAVMGREPITAASAVLDAVAAQPELPSNVSREEFEFAAAELLAEVGEQPGVLDLFIRGLEHSALRVVLLDAIALLAARAAAPALAALARAQVPDPSLSSRELVRLASALGCVGGAEALAVVEELRAHRGWPPEVARELEIAYEALRH
jgi:hypothetical protein